jgi:hypothetical protein
VRFAAIDSGIDLVAVALFDSVLCPVSPRTGDPNGFTRAAAGLWHTFTIATPPGTATVARCAEISQQLRSELTAPLDYAIIEIPRNAYRSEDAIRRRLPLQALNESLMLLNRGIGAIAAGMAGTGQLLETRAFASRKEHRRIEVNAALTALDRPAVRNGDVVDAIHIGLVWMTEYLRHPDVFDRNVFRGELYHTWTAAELARREAEQKAAARAERQSSRARKPAGAPGGGRRRG